MTQSTGGANDEGAFHAKLARGCILGILELGVLNGDTSRILLNNSVVPVWGIDPLIPDSMDAGLIGSADAIKSRVGDDPRYQLIQDYGQNVVGDFSHPLDYIFIDADHRYECVKYDFESWLPKLVTGGHIALHDSAANRGGPHFWPGPSRLADELLNDDRVSHVQTVFTMTVFKKL